MPFWERMWARLFAARYDRQIEDGIPVVAGTPLAAHYVRLVSRQERDDMAEAMRLLLRNADTAPRARGSARRVPFDTDAVRRSAAVVEDVLVRLTGPQPVRARGMARLRILLSDGRSPLYRAGGGTLAAAMRGVLAAM
ncbi:hypothetical protein [Mycolicibacterium sp.]|uniref:hypothetical protein n=1 Tax=Mycolicibacterium sp. TaxID=2320850 RepID=UPI001A354444|nr:hypothetical protein [Mycolicibacterium sp.]MBJ7341000.1 hypothetical protein [Mycolicibacterium sp.]